MTEDETVEEVESKDNIDELNKEAREYSQEYITELISASKEYLPKAVWDHIHRKAVPKAGGKASGKSKRSAAAARAASSEAEGTAGQAVTQPPEVEAQLQAVREQTQKADMHPDCEKVAKKCMELKKEETEKADAGTKEVVMKPFPNEHAGRIKDPGEFEPNSFRRMNRNSDGKQYSVVMGKLKGSDKMTEQTLRYPKEEWSAAEAKTHAEAHGAKGFEAASSNAEKSVEKAETRIETFVGSHPLITFVAASPSVYESIRKGALVGPAGKLFNERYLKPLGITRDNINISYLVPYLLKDEEGKPREPTPEEIAAEQQWRVAQEVRLKGAPTIVALGHTVKKSLGHVDITLPHPNALGSLRTNEELERKLHQLERMLKARVKKR